MTKVKQSFSALEDLMSSREQQQGERGGQHESTGGPEGPFHQVDTLPSSSPERLGVLLYDMEKLFV